MYDQNMIIYGGSNGQVLLSDMWSFNVYSREWSQIEQPNFNPGARSGISFATYGRYAYVFSGFNYDGSVCNTDLWRFDNEKVEWTLMPVADNSSVPAPRAGYCMKTIDHFLILFGGAKCGDKLVSNGTMII